MPLGWRTTVEYTGESSMARQRKDPVCQECGAAHPPPGRHHTSAPKETESFHLVSTRAAAMPNWNRLQQEIHHPGLKPRERRPDPKHWRAHITFSVPPLVAEEIRAAAAAQGRTVSNYLVQLFIRERDKALNNKK